jgi:hypothetical protein
MAAVSEILDSQVLLSFKSNPADSTVIALKRKRNPDMFEL